eukprot:3640470-Lingulodinium_polyedra.AAC.1
MSWPGTLAARPLSKHRPTSHNECSPNGPNCLQTWYGAPSGPGRELPQSAKPAVRRAPGASTWPGP